MFKQNISLLYTNHLKYMFLKPKQEHKIQLSVKEYLPYTKRIQSCTVSYDRYVEWNLELGMDECIRKPRSHNVCVQST